MAGATGALFVGVKARGAVFSGQPIEAGDHEHVAGVELIEGAAHVGAVDLGSATQASPPPGGMMVFLAVLTIGFIYEWKKGALEWD